jgi:hypothetical protein
VVFGPVSLAPENLLPFAPESTVQSGSWHLYSGELKRR